MTLQIFESDIERSCIVCNRVGVEKVVCYSDSRKRWIAAPVHNRCIESAFTNIRNGGGSSLQVKRYSYTGLDKISRNSTQRKTKA